MVLRGRGIADIMAKTKGENTVSKDCTRIVAHLMMFKVYGNYT